MDISQSSHKMKGYELPRLKPFIEYSVADGKIHFFARPGTAIEIADPNHFILSACKLMDGKKSIEAIQQELSVNFPQEAPFLPDLLTLLDNEYLLEDNGCCNHGTLSKYDTERWSRSIEFLGAYCKANENKYSKQEKIKNSRICLLGLGGVGSSVLLNLIAMGVQNIRAVDFDTVDLSNLNRQIIYDECDVGNSKAETAKNKVLQFYPQANIECINSKITSPECIEKFIKDCDFVINAADQPREQIIDWLNCACVKNGIPFICGALDSRYAIYYSVHPGKSGCIECWKSQARKSSALFQDFYRNGEFHTAESANVTIMPFISIISGLMCADLLKLITGIAEPLSLGTLNSYDFIDGKISTLESWGRNQQCAVCSGINS